MKELTRITPATALDILIKSIDDDLELGDSTKHRYKQAILNCVESGCNILDPEELRTYALLASDSTRSFLKAGIRKLALSLESQAKSGATPDNIDQVTAIVYRSQSLMDVIKLSNKKGETFHLWLSAAELKKLLGLTRKNGSSLVEIRDRVSLGLMSNAMLRRAEVVSLEFQDLKERDDLYILDVKGKGNKQRQVKLSPELARDILKLKELWGEGKIVRSISKAKENPIVGDSITSQSLYRLVVKYGKLIKKDLRPHDLRRTGAKISHKAGIPIEQISLSLGHSQLETTMSYLGIEREWESQPSDVIPY